MFGKKVAVIVFVTIAIGMVAACKKKGALVGSCDRRASDAPRSLCIDAYDGKDGLTLSACERDRGSEIPAGKKSEAACDHSSALAGCKLPGSIEWYFPSGRVKTVENVAAVCMGTLLGPDSKELTGVAKTDLKTDEQTSAEADVAKWKPDLEAKFAMIERIAKSLPPPTKKLKAASAYAGTKHLVVDAADSVNIAANADVAHRDDASTVLAQCVRIVRKNDMTGIQKPAEPLERCHDAKLVVIQRTASIQEPVWTTSGTTRDAYKAGHARGDVLVYDLATGTLLGASPWDAESSRDFSSTWDNAKKALAADFDKQIDIARVAATYQASGGPTTSK
jgi:hypothetical protein